MKSINVVCVGFNQESLVCLKKFFDNGISISGLISKEKQIEHRGSDYIDMEPLAMKNSIPYLETDDINSTHVKKWLYELNIDVIFILAWSQLFDEELLAIPKMTTIGSHPSKLPYGAGRAPVVWSVLENINHSAVTFFKLTKDVDAGGVYLQKEFKIPSASNSREVYDVVSENLSNGFLEIYNKIVSGTLEEQAQDFSNRIVRARRTIEDGFLDFVTMGVDEVDVLIRATTEPYPGAFSYYEGQKVIFWNATIEKNVIHKGTKGQILTKKHDSLLVQCSDSAIWLSDIYIYNSKADLKVFKIGTKFGMNFINEIEKLNQKIKKLEEVINELV